MPGGVESESRRLLQAIDAADDEASVASGSAADRCTVDHVEVRDDRVLFFFATAVRDGAFTLRHRVRALFEGRYACGSASIEALYEPGLAATVASPLVEVVR